MPADGPVLDVAGLNAAYGEAKVLFDIDLCVAPRQIVACIGRNGAGKTTLLRCICGFVKPLSGVVRSHGSDLIGLAPYDVAKSGVKYVPQDKKVFYDLTVRENLELGSYASGDRNWEPALNYFPKLKVHMDRKAGYMSGGERQMLMIARALLGNPRLLLIDEPTEGLAPGIVSHLREVFTDIARKTSLVIVEQNLPLVCAIADVVYGIRDGLVAAMFSQRSEMSFQTFEKFL